MTSATGRTEQNPNETTVPGGAHRVPIQPPTAIAQKTDTPWGRWTQDGPEDVVLRVLAWCSILLRCRPDLDAWDACQDVMVVLLRRDFGKRFNPAKGMFWPFVYGICKYVCRSAARRPGVRTISGLELRDLAASVSSDPEVAAMNAEFATDLEVARHSLTPIERESCDRVKDRAEGVRYPPAQSGDRRHVQDFRCRRKLRRLLRQHRP